MKLFIILLLLASPVFSCDIVLVINEISNFHGPSWGTFLDNKKCTREQTKNYLKLIITDHETVLSNFDYPTRRLLYRNAVSSYGSFLKVDKESGVLDRSEKDFLEDFYKNPSSYLGSNLYNGEQDRFRLKILESYKNTASLDALEFMIEVLENENEPAYIAKNAAMFGQEIIEGKIEQERVYGDRVYEEDFYPNLKLKLSKRFMNKEASDELEAKFQKTIKSYISKAISDPVKSKIIKDLQVLLVDSFIPSSTNNRLPASEPERARDLVKDNPKDLKREPQSIEKESKNANKFYIGLVLLFLVLGLIIRKIAK